MASLFYFPFEITGGSGNAVFSWKDLYVTWSQLL